MLVEALGFRHTDRGIVTALLTDAPMIAASFLISYGVLVALTVRALSPLVRAGWHPDEGATGWALWFTEALMGEARVALFSLYSSVYIRPWLRLAGVPVGPRTEVSTGVGLNRLTSLDHTSFAADDVVFATSRARDGWLHVAPIAVGSRTFLGNGAILLGDTKLGNDSLVGVLTTPPLQSSHGSSWFGSPAIELPRIADRPDPGRTTRPPRRLIAARGATELVRILFPATVSVALAALVFWALESIGLKLGIAAMVVATPLLLVLAGVCAAALTVATKWVVMGRYRSGEHPLWSFFVWRDEIINSTPGGSRRHLVARVRARHTGDVGVPEGDGRQGGHGCLVRDARAHRVRSRRARRRRGGEPLCLRRDASVPRSADADRPGDARTGATLGPSSAVLPDTVLGAGCCVGGRSVVLRGEELPPGTRWHGSPVVSA